MMVGAAPDNGSALLAAAHWLEGLVQGQLAVTLAVLAMAATGLMMLSGRLQMRRGLVVTLGCFILFGAPAIARGLLATATGMASMSEDQIGPMEPLAAPPSLTKPKPVQDQVADPYAGASIAR